MKRLRRIAVLAAVIGCLGACNSAPRAGAPATSTPSPIAHPSPTPTPTITVIRTGPVVRAGATVDLRFQAGVSLRVTASKPHVSRTRLSSSYGYGPAHGYYVTFDVTLVNTGTQPIDVGPTNFYVVVRSEGKVTTLMGNAPYSGASEQLDATQLEPGARLTGPVTFDVRRPTGALSFAPDKTAAATWRY